jgi:hypothetical protein
MNSSQSSFERLHKLERSAQSHDKLHAWHDSNVRKETNGSSNSRRKDLGIETQQLPEKPETSEKPDPFGDDGVAEEQKHTEEEIKNFHRSVSTQKTNKSWAELERERDERLEKKREDYERQKRERATYKEPTEEMKNIKDALKGFKPTIPSPIASPNSIGFGAAPAAAGPAPDSAVQPPPAVESNNEGKTDAQKEVSEYETHQRMERACAMFACIHSTSLHASTLSLKVTTKLTNKQATTNLSTDLRLQRNSISVMALTTYTYRIPTATRHAHTHITSSYPRRKEPGRRKRTPRIRK